MIGIGTATADDRPDLPGLETRSPVRIVMDSGLRLPLASRLVRTAKSVPTWIVTLPGADQPASAPSRSAASSCWRPAGPPPTTACVRRWRNWRARA